MIGKKLCASRLIMLVSHLYTSKEDGTQYSLSFTELSAPAGVHRHGLVTGQNLNHPLPNSEHSLNTGPVLTKILKYGNNA